MIFKYYLIKKNHKLKKMLKNKERKRKKVSFLSAFTHLLLSLGFFSSLIKSHSLQPLPKHKPIPAVLYGFPLLCHLYFLSSYLHFSLLSPLRISPLDSNIYFSLPVNFFLSSFSQQICIHPHFCFLFFLNFLFNSLSSFLTFLTPHLQK